MDDKQLDEWHKQALDWQYSKHERYAPIGRSWEQLIAEVRRLREKNARLVGRNHELRAEIDDAECYVTGERP